MATFEAKRVIVVNGIATEDPVATIFQITDPQIHNWSWLDDLVVAITYIEKNNTYVCYNCVDPKAAAKLFDKYRD